MIDFESAVFDKQFRTGVTASAAPVQSKYPLVPLGTFCAINTPKTEIKNVPDDTQVTFIDMPSVGNTGRIEKRENLPIGQLRHGSYTYFAENDILIAKITPCMENGKCAIATGLENKIGFGSSEFHTFRPDKKKCLSDYLFIFLNREDVRKRAKAVMTGSSGHRRVPETFYSNFGIPLPPLSVQQQVVGECAAVDADCAKAEAAISDAKAKIADAFAKGQKHASETFSLGDEARFSLQIGRRVLETQLTGASGIPVFSANVFEPFGNIGAPLKTLTDFSKDSVLWGIDGDWMVSFMPKGKPFYPTDHCGVLRILAADAHPRYIVHALETAGNAAGFKRSYRASIDRVKSLSIPLPPLSEQKKIVAAVEVEEAKIAAAKTVLADAPARKAAVLANHGILQTN